MQNTKCVENAHVMGGAHVRSLSLLPVQHLHEHLQWRRRPAIHFSAAISISTALRLFIPPLRVSMTPFDVPLVGPILAPVAPASAAAAAAAVPSILLLLPLLPVLLLLLPLLMPVLLLLLLVLFVLLPFAPLALLGDRRGVQGTGALSPQINRVDHPSEPAGGR
jgi:hypothetical protein